MNIQIEKVNPNKLSVDGLNPNKMNPQSFQALKRNIEKYGFLVPIITNKDYVIADGQHRWEVAKELSLAEVLVIKLDVSEVDRRMIRQIMNKLKGSHDEEKDLSEFAFIAENGNYEEFYSLLPNIKDFEGFMNDINKEKDPDDFDADKVAEQPKYDVKLGDIYQLGNHRLMCGNSCERSDVKKLMQDAKVQCVFTDPPYGVSYKGTNNPNGREWEIIKNDELRGDTLYEFLRLAFNNAESFMKDDAALYTCYASINHYHFEKALNDSLLKVKQQLIWDKGHVLGHSDYHWCHEPILYCSKQKSNCLWFGDRTQKTILENSWVDTDKMTKDEMIAFINNIKEASDLIRIRKDAATDYIHPTQKPVELPKRLIRNSSQLGDNILDLFGGSGSTLIACEITKRNAYIMELDPKYASAIIQRWEEFTGNKAVKL